MRRKREDENGRGGEIRTHDLLYPKQARYQATLRPEPDGRAACGVRRGIAMVFFTLKMRVGVVESGQCC